VSHTLTCTCTAVQLYSVVCKQLQELGKAVFASIKAWYALLTGPIGVTPTLLTGEWDPRLMSIVIRVRFVNTTLYVICIQHLLIPSATCCCFDEDTSLMLSTLLL
jgi:hypothetical protein